ncbi:MAG: IPT/TIG domain-containing protein [bacterium]|nr:IPT/TIG domain-containing protein [bacterium]
MNTELGIRNQSIVAETFRSPLWRFKNRRYIGLLWQPKALRYILMVFSFFIASPAFAQVTAEVQGLALSGTDPRIIVAKIIRVALGFLGTVALVLILYGGYLWMTAAGNEETIDKAKKVLTQAIIGLAIILSALSITQFIISKLVEAINGPGEVSVSSFSGGGGGLPLDSFTVRSIDPKGSVPIRNIVAQVVFSRTPSRDTANLEQNVIVSRKDNGAKVEVAYSVTGTTLELRPKTACPSPNEERKCFDGDTDFKVELSTGLLSVAGRNLICGGLAPLCTGEFRTGNLIDVAAPKIEITDPGAGGSVAVDTCVRVQAKVTDDAGIRRVEFYADGAPIVDGIVSPPGIPNPREATVEIPCWAASPPAPSRHTLTAKVFDIDDNNATSSGVEVVVRPLHCFNTDSAGVSLKDDDEDGPNCDNEVAGPSGCGLCGGAVCTNNRDCMSGFCINGRCASPTIITGISPGDGKAGTFVTVAGFGFGATPGKVIFKDNKIATAPAACADAISWSDNYALIGVPEGAVTGSVKIETANCPADNNLCRDSSDDARGPVVPTGGQVTDGSFEVNEVTHPGLCSVASPPENRSQGLWGTRVELSGVQFGTDQGDGNIFFGASSGAGIANWSDTGATTAAPSIDYGPVSVQLSNREKILSNSLPYKILSPDAGTLPEIVSITPPSGGEGTGVTIKGHNFGENEIGAVYFIATDGTATLADTSVPSQCGSTWWGATSITVKVPRGLTINPNYKVYVHRYDGQQSNKKTFAVTNTPAGPFLACIRPVAGPRFINVSVYGEGLGESVSPPRGLYFTQKDSTTVLAYDAQGTSNVGWTGRRATLTNVGGVRSDACPSSGWSGTEVCAQIPQDARTGDILAEQDMQGITRRSNPLVFTVGSCLLPQNDPSYFNCASGLTCCGDGSCNSVCPTIVTPSSAYGWQFTTSPAPIVPEVLAQCDTTVGDGHPLYPPSPSPSAASGRGSDADVCVNAQVAVTLSTAVVPTTLSANTIKIEKCTGAQNLISGANASFSGGNTSVWNRPPAPAIVGAPAHASQLKVTYEQGQGRAFDLTDDPGNWALRLTKLDDDTGKGFINDAGLQQNYEHWFGYQANSISDTNGKTYTATAYMKAPDGDLAAVGKRAGILIQRAGGADGMRCGGVSGGIACEVDATCTTQTDASKRACLPTAGFWQKASSEITLTSQWQPVSVSIAFDTSPNGNVPGFVRVFMEGMPYDIRVDEPAPDPTQLFSVLVDDVQLTGDPCTQVGSNLFSTSLNFERASQDRGFRWFPSASVDFDTNSWYRVTLLGGKDGIKASDVRGQEMAIMENPQVSCGYANAAYCFRFKTKNVLPPAENLCDVGGIAVTPSPFTARGENEMIDYGAVPVAAGDPCVSIRPDSYTWSWESADINKAIVSYNNSSDPSHIGRACASEADCAIRGNVCSNDGTKLCATNADCVSGGTCTPQAPCNGGYCRFMGWTTTATALEETDDLPGDYVGIKALTGSVVGEGKLTIEFEPPRVISYFPNCGEACINAEIGVQFNKAMRAVAADTDAVTNPANVQVWAVPCGNSIKDAGEDCDDGNIVSGDGCSAICLNEGSGYALRCGDGNKDTFEDCDDGNLSSGDGCSDRCIHEGTSTTCGNGGEPESGEDCDDHNTQNGDGCSSTCLHEGTRSDIAICGNGRLDRGEECESNFEGTFESWCDEQTCLRQGSVPAARCGNGRIDPGEECDPNSPLLNSPAKKTLCNATCQWTGTLRPTSSGGQGCGNARIEIGEDCDDGNLRPADGCDSNCRNEGSASGDVPACGNGGAPDAGEDCDDGNIAEGDGCSSKCLNEGRPGASCGNGFRDFGEDCDLGAAGIAICSTDCKNLGTDPLTGTDPAKPNTCGNGEVDDGEDCDGGAYCTTKCLHVNGRPPNRVASTNFTFGWDPIRNELTVTPNPSTLLSGRTFYRVLVRGDDPATAAVEGVRASRGSDLVSGKALVDNLATADSELNYIFNWGGSIAPTPEGHDCKDGACNTFSWTFRTKEEVCGVNTVDVSPPEASLFVIGGRQSYSSVPIGPPDACNPQGQRLNSLSYNWGWDTLAHTIATIVDEQNPAVSPYGVNVIPSCGNGRIDKGEDCDDGNTVSHDGCSGSSAPAPCTNEGSEFEFACGNGRLDPGEECENPDGLLCSPRCLRLGNTACVSGNNQNCCGNTIAEDGRGDDLATLTNEGRANYGEDCDDGNTIAGDGCSPRCLNEGSSPQTGVCGNGRSDPGEECDPNASGVFTSGIISGNTIALPPSRLLCDPNRCLFKGTSKVTRCDNQKIETGEECEDENTISGDGCSTKCLREGTRQSPAGNCGNGRLDPHEDCDDGNIQNEDGCSNRCLNEGKIAEQGPVSSATLPETPPRIDPYQQAEARGIAKFCRPIAGIFPANPDPCTTTCNDVGEICAPPNPWTTVGVTAAAQGKIGNAALTVYCVAATDKDCPIPGGSGSNTNPAGGHTTIGRGFDNCCYARPQVLERIPEVGEPNVCRNGLLRAVFNQDLDKESLIGNFGIARRDELGLCEAGEQQLDAQGNVVAAPTVAGTPLIPVWCVASDLTLSPELTSGAVILRPSKLLGSETKNIRYRIALVGDKNITDAQVSGLRSIYGAGFYWDNPSPTGQDSSVDQTWEFTTGRDICTLDKVEVKGSTSFRSSGESVNTEAIAYSTSRTPPQPISPSEGYSWGWSWGTSDGQIVTVTNTPDATTGETLNKQVVSSGTKDGVARVNATATITEDIARNASHIGQCRALAGSTPAVKECFNYPDRICITDADCGELIGTPVAGNAEFSTVLCQNPWPENPNTLYRLIDTAEHILGVTLAGVTRATNFSTRYCRDGNTVLPELRYLPTVLVPPVIVGSEESQVLKEVLLTTKTFGGEVSIVGEPQTPASQATTDQDAPFTYTFNFPDNGDYEFTVETSHYNPNGGAGVDDLSNLAEVLEAKSISQEVRDYLKEGPNGPPAPDGVDAGRLTGAYYHTLRVLIDGVERGIIRAKAVSASAPHSQGKVILQAVAKGPHTVSVDWINDDRLPSTDIVVDEKDYDAGEIWDANLRIHKLTLKKGRAKDDAIGIRIMSNPGRLSVGDWYTQMNFGGQPTPYATPIDGYEAIKDGNTIYIGATNVDPVDPLLPDGDRVVYGNVYLLSLSELAHPSVKSIFEEIIKNIAFNVNLENLKTCAQNFCSNNTGLPCSTSLGCGSGQCIQKSCSKNLDCAIADTMICRADKDKLARDLIRLNHIETITSVLNSYQVSHDGKYPTLEAGTFIRGMSTSRWPSWQTSFGSILGSPLPQDPINLFGAICTSAPEQVGTFDPTTCWNELAQTYRCPSGSHVYQYEAQGGEGYKLKTELELVERPGSTIPTWNVDGWDPLSSAVASVSTGGTCTNTTWSNAVAACGNRVIETGEQCEPGSFDSTIVSFGTPGEKRCSGKPSVTCSTIEENDPCPVGENENSQGICLRLTSCTARRSCQLGCRWNSWLGGSIAGGVSAPAGSAGDNDCVAGGTFCGNGVRDQGETCDDGLLNNQYGKCNATCTGLGSYCGDNVRNGLETCDGNAGVSGATTCNNSNGSYGCCRFDCSGIGEQCGDGSVDSLNEQCEIDETQIFSGRCNGGSNANAACTNDAACGTVGDCVFCEFGELGSPMANTVQNRQTQLTTAAGYPYQWKRNCNSGCQWESSWSCAAQGTCGNRRIDGNEQCDDGNDDNTDGCIITNLNGPFNVNNNCVRARCNDGFNLGNVCTAGPAERRGETCTTNEQCGAGGVCQDPEECDLGNAINGQPCVAPYNGNCTACDRSCNIVTQSGGVCGDTVLQSPEEQCEGTQGFATSGVPTWVCQGTVGGSERFWNFRNNSGVSAWTKSGDGVALTRVTPGYNSASAMKLKTYPAGDGVGAWVGFADTGGKRYVASLWANTLQTDSSLPARKIRLRLQGRGSGLSDEVQLVESSDLNLDRDIGTWQYLELTANYDTERQGITNGVLEIWVPDQEDGAVPDEVLVDQVHLRPGTPSCNGNDCTRQCLGGSVCPNVLKRCEGGSTPGAECATNANCNPGGTSGGTCEHHNSDQQGSYLWSVAPGLTVACVAGAGQDCNWYKYKPPPTLGIALRADYVAGDSISDTCDNDDDNDGYPEGGAGLDCDDKDARRNPDKEDVCDLVDNDCVGGVDDQQRTLTVEVWDHGIESDDTFKVYVDGVLWGTTGRGQPITLSRTMSVSCRQVVNLRIQYVRDGQDQDNNGTAGFSVSGVDVAYGTPRWDSGTDTTGDSRSSVDTDEGRAWLRDSDGTCNDGAAASDDCTAGVTIPMTVSF